MCVCVFIFSHFNFLVKHLIAYVFVFKEILFHALFRMLGMKQPDSDVSRGNTSYKHWAVSSVVFSIQRKAAW